VPESHEVLERQFNEAMERLYRETGEATRHLEKPYWPHRFLQSVRRIGGIATARKWLMQPKPGSGFGKIAEIDRLDLSVESVILQRKWHPLFTDEERRVARTRLRAAGYIRLPEEVESDETLIEGAVHSIVVNAYERNPEARRRCIEVHGTKCCVCEFSFGEIYGPMADGYIHVHHTRPLSTIRGEYRVDPVNDLRPVCPNCHAVIHLNGECRDIESVRKLLSRGV
jgi:hypothetical protein